MCEAALAQSPQNLDVGTRWERRWYEGGLKNGMRHGNGVQHWDQGPLIGCTFTGEFAHGLPHGRGKLSHPGDLRFFEGKWEGGVLHCFSASMHMDDKNSFEGSVQHGVIDGRGKWTRGARTIQAEWRAGVPVAVDERSAVQCDEEQLQEEWTWPYGGIKVAEAVRDDPLTATALGEEAWCAARESDLEAVPARELEVLLERLQMEDGEAVGLEGPVNNRDGQDRDRDRRTSMATRTTY